MGRPGGGISEMRLAYRVAAGVQELLPLLGSIGESLGLDGSLLRSHLRIGGT